MGIRVLVVEDEAKIADFLIRGLREEGYAVEHAADGGVGLALLFGSGEWDLVIARLVAARPGWADALAAVSPVGRHTPVLFLDRP